MEENLEKHNKLRKMWVLFTNMKIYEIKNSKILKQYYVYLFKNNLKYMYFLLRNLIMP